MRLIDADELSNNIKSLPYRYLPVLEWVEEIYKLIDNAPTVETDIEVVAKDAYEHGYSDGWKERFGEPSGRPKGEWIEYKEDNEIRYYCSNCMVTKGQAVNNFCACCGADMRKENKGND